MAEELGLDELRAHVLDSVGVVKVYSGDRSGLLDIEASVELARAIRSPEAARALNNLGACYGTLGDLPRATQYVDEALAVAERLGNLNLVSFSRTFRLWLGFRAGAWNESLFDADAFIATADAGQPHYHESQTRICRAFARLARDDIDGAVEDARKALPAARRAADPQNLLPTLSGAARVLLETGHREEARAVADEALAGAPFGHGAELAWVGADLQLSEEVEAWLARGLETNWKKAARAVLRGDFGEAATVYDEIGDAPDAARAHLRAAEILARAGRRADADEHLQSSLAYWRSVHATRYVRDGELLLSAAS